MTKISFLDVGYHADIATPRVLVFWVKVNNINNKR